LRCLGRLIVGVDLEMLVALLDRPFGAVSVGRRQCGAHIFQANPVFEQSERVQFDSHRRQRAAADPHLADTIDLRQGGCQHRRGGIVNLALG
jgi:hypothetical protein